MLDYLILTFEITSLNFVLFLKPFQQSQSDRSMSVCSLGQQVGLAAKGSPYKRVDSMRPERSSTSAADDESRRVSFDVDEPGMIRINFRGFILL